MQLYVYIDFFRLLLTWQLCNKNLLIFSVSWQLCNSVFAMAVTLMCITRVLVVGITSVRLISIIDPLNFKSRVTPQRTITSIVLIYVLTALIILSLLSVQTPGKS